MPKKSDFLREPIEHIDIRKIDAIPIVEMGRRAAFSARDLARAAEIYDAMLRDPECTIFLCLAGSLFSAGLKKVVYDLVQNNMVDLVVSTGAILVDQDFFEALGFRHYRGDPRADDATLQKLHIDRIYDTYIDEDELRICDGTVRKIADGLEPRPRSSREFLIEMGRYLQANARNRESVVLAAFEKGVPLFVPAFSDCSAGFGLIAHQHRRPENHVSIDSVKDFLELTRIKAASKESGLVMIGGGVPKNFAQDSAVATGFLGKPETLHKYAVQITVADVRDGALSSSTLREANSWGKVALEKEQMVYCEATIAFPILAAYAYQQGAWKNRRARNWNRFLDERPPTGSDGSAPAGLQKQAGARTAPCRKPLRSSAAPVSAREPAATSPHGRNVRK